MTSSEKDTLLQICRDEPWNAARSVREYVANLPDEEPAKEKRGTRSLSQNAAMWRQHEIAADDLVKNGVTMRKIYEATKDFDIPPTKDSVHEFWLYFQRIMYPQWPSSKDLPKHGDHYQKIHDVMMKNLGEKFHIEYFPFPSEELRDVRLEVVEATKESEYPELNETNNAERF